MSFISKQSGENNGLKADTNWIYDIWKNYQLES